MRISDWSSDVCSSDLRPDVAEAERKLNAANARIGVARAALFPAITLGLGGGFQAKAAPLLSAPTGFWALGPLSTVLNLFDGGRRRAQVDIRKADYDEQTGRAPCRESECTNV